jgi:hypothetical protein
MDFIATFQLAMDEFRFDESVPLCEDLWTHCGDVARDDKLYSVFLRGNALAFQGQRTRGTETILPVLHLSRL